MIYIVRQVAPVVAAFLAASLTPALRAVDLVAGPAVGHVTDKSARLWMQFPIAGEVSVEAYGLDGEQARHPVCSLRVGLEGPSPFVCDVPISGLKPDSSYRVEVKFEGQSVKLPEVILRTAPAPGDQAVFSVAFGGGLAIEPVTPRSPTTGPSPAAAPPAAARHDIPIFRAINELKPRAFLFLGNAGYLPPALDQFPVTHRAAFRFISDFRSAIRREPDLQELFCTTPCYAIYGDRDFGTTDSGSSFVFAQESLVSFERFWPNPDWGTPENPGCYCTFRFGDADFFLLDTRTFRQSPEPQTTAAAASTAAAGQMLGPAQIDWLKKNLRASSASFKILAAPCTLWGDDVQHPDPDSWSRFPAEQQAFLSWLGQNQINGIVALAGNHGAGGLTRVDPLPPAAAIAGTLRYPLYTLASSTLFGSQPAPAVPQPNPRSLAPPIAGNTFGTLDFGGMTEHRFLTLRIRDQTGKTRLEQTLFATQLRN